MLVVSGVLVVLSVFAMSRGHRVRRAWRANVSVMSRGCSVHVALFRMLWKPGFGGHLGRSRRLMVLKVMVLMTSVGAAFDVTRLGAVVVMTVRRLRIAHEYRLLVYGFAQPN